jgi:hypothetical protein
MSKPTLTMILYVEGRSAARDLRAFKRICDLCHEHLQDGYAIELIEVSKNQKRAFEDGVITTPMVILEKTGIDRKKFADLNELETFLSCRNDPEEAVEVIPFKRPSLVARFMVGT